MHPDDIRSVLDAAPFLPFDVELPNNGSFRVTDPRAAKRSLSPRHRALDM